MGEENSSENGVSSEHDDTTEGNATTVTSEPTWKLTDDIPGAGEPPEYFKADKYKTLADQAKAYKDLEGRFGSFSGAPEEYEDVKLNENLTELGIEIKKDDPLYEKAVEFAKESNMNQTGFEKMIGLYANSMAVEQQALNDYKTEQLKALGANAETRISNLNSWANANLDTESFESFQALATNAEAVIILERLVGMTGASPIAGNKTVPVSGITEDEIKAMQFEKDEYGNRRIQTDRAFRKKFEDAANRFYGTGDNVVTIG